VTFVRNSAFLFLLILLYHCIINTALTAVVVGACTL